jgi:hypothetical protein
MSDRQRDLLAGSILFLAIFASLMPFAGTLDLAFRIGRSIGKFGWNAGTTINGYSAAVLVLAHINCLALSVSSFWIASCRRLKKFAIGLSGILAISLEAFLLALATPLIDLARNF